MAAQDATTDEMFTAAKYANAFWFPQQSLEMAIFFQNSKGQPFDVHLLTNDRLEPEKLLVVKSDRGP